MLKKGKNFALTLIVGLVCMLAGVFAVQSKLQTADALSIAASQNISNMEDSASNIVSTGTEETDDFGHTWCIVTKNGNQYRCISEAADLAAIDGRGTSLYNDSSSGAANKYIDALKANLKKNYILTNDINWGGNQPWEPIGSSPMNHGHSQKTDLFFCGKFDGAGYKIINLKIDNNFDGANISEITNCYNTGETDNGLNVYALNFGLFLGIGINGEVHDLAIINPIINITFGTLKNNSYSCRYVVNCGILAGESYGGTISNIYISANQNQMQISINSNNSYQANGVLSCGCLIGTGGKLVVTKCLVNSAGITINAGNRNTDLNSDKAIRFHIGGFVGNLFYPSQINDLLVFNDSVLLCKNFNIKGTSGNTEEIEKNDTVYLAGIGTYSPNNASEYNKVKISNNFVKIDAIDTKTEPNNGSGFNGIHKETYIARNDDSQPPLDACYCSGDLTTQGYKIDDDDWINSDDGVKVLNNDNHSSEWKINAVGTLPIQRIFAYKINLDCNGEDSAIKEGKTITNKYYSRFDASGIDFTDNNTTVYVTGFYNDHYTKLQSTNYSLYTNSFEQTSAQEFKPNYDNQSDYRFKLSDDCWEITLTIEGIGYSTKLDEQITINYLSDHTVDHADMASYVEITDGWDGTIKSDGFDTENPNYAKITRSGGNYTLTIGSSNKTAFSCTLSLKDADNYEIFWISCENCANSGSKFSVDGNGIEFNKNNTDNNGIMTIKLILKERSVGLTFKGEFENGDGSKIKTYGTPISSNFYGENGDSLGGVEIETRLPTKNITISKNTKIYFDNGEHTSANEGYFTHTDVPGYKFLGWSVNGGEPSTNSTFTASENCTIVAKYEVIKYTISATTFKGETDESETISQSNNYTIETGLDISSNDNYNWVVVVDSGHVKNADAWGTESNTSNVILTNNEEKASLHFVYLTSIVNNIQYNKIKDIYGNTIYFLSSLQEGSYGNCSVLNLREKQEFSLTIDANYGDVPNNSNWQNAGILSNSGTGAQQTFTVSETSYYQFMASESALKGLAFCQRDDFTSDRTICAKGKGSIENNYYAVYNYGHFIVSWEIKITGDFGDFSELYFVIRDNHWEIYSSKNGYLNPYGNDGWKTDAIDIGTAILPSDMDNQFTNVGEVSMNNLVFVLSTIFATNGKVANNITITITPTWQAANIILKTSKSETATTYDENYNLTQNVTYSEDGKSLAYFTYKMQANMQDTSARYAIIPSAKFNYQTIDDKEFDNYKYSIGNSIYTLNLQPRYLDNIYKVSLLNDAGNGSNAIEGDLNYLRELTPEKWLDNNDDTTKYAVIQTNDNYGNVYEWNNLPNVIFYNYYDNKVNLSDNFWATFAGDANLTEDDTTYCLVDSYISKYFAIYISRYDNYIGNPTSYRDKNGAVYKDKENIGQSFASTSDKGVNYTFNNPKLLLNVFYNSQEIYIFLANESNPAYVPAFNKTISDTNYTLNYWFNNGINSDNVNMFFTALATDETKSGLTKKTSDTWVYAKQDKIENVPYLKPNFYRESYKLSVTFQNYGYIVVKIYDTILDFTSYIIKINNEWYEYIGEINTDDNIWEIPENLTSAENIIRSGCDVCFYLGDQSTSPVAMKTGNYDNMIGHRALNLLSNSNTSGLLNMDEDNKYIYTISAGDIANKNYENGEYLSFIYNLEYINYSLQFAIDNPYAGGFNVGGSQSVTSNDGQTKTITNIHANQNTKFTFTYNAELGYEFNNVPFTLIVWGKTINGRVNEYILPLSIIEMHKQDDGSYIQTFEFTITGTWLREHYYYPINTLNSTATNYNQYFEDNMSFLADDAEIGKMQIGTKLIEFNVKIKYKNDSLSSDEYFVDENGNTIYTTYSESVVLNKNASNNKFVMKNGNSQLGLQLVGRTDGVNGQIYVKTFNGKTYTMVKSYAEAVADLNNTKIDERLYSLPYVESLENVVYYVYNDAAARVHYINDKIVNDNDRTLYYVYVITPLFTLDVVGEADKNDVNMNTRQVTVGNTSEYTKDNVSSVMDNKKDYILTRDQNKTADEHFWADSLNNQIVVKLYVTKNVTTTISESYDHNCYADVEYYFNGYKLLGNTLSDIDGNCELAIIFIPKQLELEVNYYVYNYGDSYNYEQGNEIEKIKVDFNYLKANKIVGDDVSEITLNMKTLYFNDEIGFEGFAFSEDYFLTVTVNSMAIRERAKYDSNKDLYHTYTYTIQKEDFSLDGKIIMDFIFDLDDNSLVNFVFDLSNQGGSKKPNDDYGIFVVEIYEGDELKDSKQTEMPQRLVLRILKGRRIFVSIKPNVGYTYYGYSKNSGSITVSENTQFTNGKIELTNENGFEANDSTTYTIFVEKDVYNLTLDYNDDNLNLGEYKLQTDSSLGVYVGTTVSINRTENEKEAFNGYYVENDGEKYYAYLDGWFSESHQGTRVVTNEFTFAVTSQFLGRINPENGDTIVIKVDHSEKFAMEIVVDDLFKEISYSTSPEIFNLEAKPIYYNKDTIITVRLKARFKYFKVVISGLVLEGETNYAVPNTAGNSFDFQVTLNKDYLGDNAIKIKLDPRQFSQHTKNNFVYNNLNELYASPQQPHEVSGYENCSEQTYYEYYNTPQVAHIYEEIGSGDNRAKLKYIKISGNDFVNFTIVIGKNIQVIPPENYAATISDNTIIITDEEGNVKEFTLTKNVLNINGVDVDAWDFGYTLQGDIDIFCEYVDYKIISATN